MELSIRRHNIGRFVFTILIIYIGHSLKYLEHGGVGIGTPSARQRQYQQHRVSNALENVREWTIEKTLRESDSVSYCYYLRLSYAASSSLRTL